MTADVLTSAELAAHLRTSERTVARMVAEGCPSMLVGRRRRFLLPAVLDWTQSRATCLSDKTTRDAGTQRPASAVAAFTADFRRAALRVTPSASKQS